MEQKEIILHLIKQELKYAQLIHGMKKVGFVTETHNISMLEVIVAILVYPLGDKELYYEILNEIGEVYNECLHEAQKYPSSIFGEELDGLSRKTYMSLIYHLRSK